MIQHDNSIWAKCVDCQRKGLYETCNHHELVELLEIITEQLQEIINRDY